jgi:hypothetical protein
VQKIGIMKKIEKGFVAVFDILGYKSLIKNNRLIETATLVSEFIEKLPSLTSKALASRYDDEKFSEVNNVLNNLLKTLIISDTIIVCLPFDFDENHDEFFRTITTVYFFSYIARLLRISCDKGLPMRGGVDHGEFYTTFRSIAGQPFLNAFNLSENLEFVGCALSDKVVSEVSKIALIDKKDGPYNNLLFQYLAPLKNKKEEKLCLLNWFYHYKDSETTNPTDIRQYLVGAFHAHSKDVSRSVYSKIENTEIILRYSATKA